MWVLSITTRTNLWEYLRLFWSLQQVSLPTPAFQILAQKFELALLLTVVAHSVSIVTLAIYIKPTWDSMTIKFSRRKHKKLQCTVWPVIHILQKPIPFLVCGYDRVKFPEMLFQQKDHSLLVAVMSLVLLSRLQHLPQPIEEQKVRIIT